MKTNYFGSIMDKPTRLNFGFNKSITVKRHGDYLNVYINDSVFEDGKLVKEKSKYIWLKWGETLKLRIAINDLEVK